MLRSGITGFCMMVPFVLASLGCSGERVSPFATGSQLRAAESGVYVSIVPKGSVSRFVTRWAAPTGQLVVTQSEVEQAEDSVHLVPRDGERLMLVELMHDQEPKLAGEMSRFGRHAVISAPFGRDAHAVLGRHDIYAEDISGPEIDHSTFSPKASLEVYTGLPADLPQVVIDREFLLQKLKEFSGEVSVTIGDRTGKISERRSTDGRALARAWLKQEYQALGYVTSEHSYGNRFAGGTNFVADRPAANGSRKFVILSAHLDSVGNAGADDDGAGVVSALAIAKALRTVPLQYGLRVVAFDQEENGLVGSAAYARFLNDNRTIAEMIGDFNLEMTGYDSDGDGGFHAIDCNENTSADLTAALGDVLGQGTIALDKVDACTNRSDHASFWRYNRPAIVMSENFFGGDGNPCYHKSCDRVDRVNIDYMAKMTRLAGLTVAAFIAEP
jgi:hypothetical protein